MVYKELFLVQVFLLINKDWSLLENSLKMDVHCLITIFKRNLLSIWSFVCVVVPKNERRRITQLQKRTSIRRRRLNWLCWNITRYYSSVWSLFVNWWHILLKHVLYQSNLTPHNQFYNDSSSQTRLSQPKGGGVNFWILNRASI